MKKIIIPLTVLLALFSVSFVYAQVVSTTPASISIPNDRKTTRSISWIITEPTGLPSATSIVGTFCNHPDNPTITLGTINRTVLVPLSLNAATGLREGSLTEALNIPLNVIKNAENNKLTTIYYRRDFFGGAAYNSVTIRLTSPAG